MRAYQDMLYGLAKEDNVKKDAIKNALLKYCKLDTLAMVIFMNIGIGLDINKKV
ncbi:MAG: hypothetical protein Q8M29_15425 [Bacteroidota bacterium]|nr:hypothetical protein [Bacteroidota bacterium]